MVKKDRPTKLQRQLLRELDEVILGLGLNYKQILDYERPARTHLLRLMLDHLIRGDIIRHYTLIDEHLNVELCAYFLGPEGHIRDCGKQKSFRT